jgi:hypothetical protein
MAGSITVSSITLDSDNNFSIKSNTGATLFFANTSGVDVANSIGATAITSDKILSVANTKISGNIISSQITSVANTQITGNIASSQITSNPTLYGNVSVTGVIAVGGATPTTNGSGITFPATQSASSNANTLDDYEEGTWTPADTSGASLSFSIAGTATYTKIGNLVTVNFFLTYPSTADGTGNNIGGLPFSIKSSTYALPSVFTNSSQTLNIYYDSSVSFSMRTNGNSTPANSAFSTKFVSATITYMTT